MRKNSNKVAQKVGKRLENDIDRVERIIKVKNHPGRITMKLEKGEWCEREVDQVLGIDGVTILPPPPPPSFHASMSYTYILPCHIAVLQHHVLVHAVHYAHMNCCHL